VAKDLSTADYFHPSFTGQAKMAESAWLAGPWASVPLP
jgi:lysophospholipase L1-like esterase